jgi:phosphoribosylanthranilate isomerase
MSGVAVKICGITSVEDGLTAAAAGADALGFVFYPRSPRAVAVEQARAIASALPPFVARVGVFVHASRDEVRTTAQQVGLDALQLYGDEAPEDFAGFGRRVIKVLRVGERIEADEVARQARVGCAILLDTASAVALGGTGQAFDWALIREVRASIPYLILAGGLSVENVGAAIRAVRPDAVDVSSGVERRPGRKDAEKVRAFIAAAKGAL